MICRTGPCGVSTWGRVGLLRNCAAAGTVPATTTTAASHDAAPPRPALFITSISAMIRGSHDFEVRQRAGAGADPVELDAVEVQDAEQHVRRALRVVGEHQVPVALERAVDAA